MIEDAADAGLEGIDKPAELRLALVGGGGRCGRLLRTQPLPLQRIAAEDRNRARDLADLVAPVVAIDGDIAVAIGDRGQRRRHRGERCGDPAHDQQGQGDDEQRGNPAGNRHRLQGLRQHRLELGHRDANVENANHLAGRTDDREIGRHERLAEQIGRALVGLAAAQQRLARMIGGQLGADGALAILLFDIGRAAHELPARLVIDEQRRVAADIGYRPVDNCVILQLGHLRQLDTGDHAVMKRDLGVVEGLAECKRQRAQIDLDVAQRAVVELLGQRPIGRAHHQCGVHRNQDDGRNDRLGAKLKPELRQQLPIRRGHEKSPSENGEFDQSRLQSP